MNFELDPPSRSEPTINLSALIDVVFILMIFVILGATFDRVRALDIELPQSDAEAEVDPDLARLQVPANGLLILNDSPVSLKELPNALEAIKGKASNLVIQADKNTPLQLAVDLLDIARAAGFEGASLSTLPRGDSG
ncbi:MAG: ExbD/TolR family protein [Myxococcota bacterium]